MSKVNKPYKGKLWCLAHHANEGEWLPVNEFYLINKADPDLGYQPKCKECAKIYMRSYNKRKRERLQAIKEGKYQQIHELEQRFLDIHSEILQNVQDSSATKVEVEVISAKLRTLISAYWEIK